MGDNSSNIYGASQAILEYYFPIIGILGLFGNIFALFILLQFKNRTLPCYRTLSALSCADIVILLCGIYQWIAHVFLSGMSDMACTVWTYLFQSATLWSSILITFITIHKYLAFISPLKSHQWRSPGTTLKIIAATCVCSLLFSIAHIFSTNSRENGQDSVCFGLTNKDTYSGVILWITFSIKVVPPVISVAIMNVLIIRALHLSNKFYKAATSIPQRYSIDSTIFKENVGGSKTEIWTTIPQTKTRNPLKHYDQPTALYHMKSAFLLVIVTFVFAFLTPPLYISHVVFSFLDVDGSRNTFESYVLVYIISV